MRLLRGREGSDLAEKSSMPSVSRPKTVQMLMFRESWCRSGCRSMQIGVAPFSALRRLVMCVNSSLEASTMYPSNSFGLRSAVASTRRWRTAS